MPLPTMTSAQSAMHGPPSRLAEQHALLAAFLAHPRSHRYLTCTPGLGDTVPLLHVNCSGDLSEATGIVVGGQGADAQGFDLDGTFTLFSCDIHLKGEFIRVNGWRGDVSILSHLDHGDPS